MAGIKTSGFRSLGDAANFSNFDERVSNGLDKIMNGPGTPPALKYKKGLLINRNDFTDKLNFQFNPETITDKRGVEYSTTHPIQSELPIYQHIHSGERTVTFKLFFNGLEDPAGLGKVKGISQPFDNKFGILSRPLQNVVDGAVGFGLSKVPFAEAVGTAGGVIFNQVFASDPAPKPGDLRPDLNVLQQMAVLDRWLHGDGVKPPAQLKFDWQGYQDSYWILTDLSFETTMWDKNQLPLHVHADLTLKEVDRRGLVNVANNSVFVR